MAECHALLYIVGAPMNTDELMERLGISRGNASMTLRTLVEWGLVGRLHLRGDRREYFRAEQDVWKLFTIILRQRKRREFDPLLKSLAECRSLTAALPGERNGRASPPLAAALEGHQSRLDAMRELLETLDRLSERFIASGGSEVQLASKLLAKDA
jgi:DNA-binding transcriptional regulator GbsR (MarR family)